MIFSAAAGGGLFASLQLEKRKRQLGSFKRAILFLNREIDYALSPLPEAFSHVAERMEEPWDRFWTEAAKELEEGRKSRMDFPEFWDRQMSKLKKLHPWQKDLELFGQLGKGLGQMDKQRQLSQLLLVEKELERLELEAGEEYRKKARLYRVLGTCLGGLAIILLL